MSTPTVLSRNSRAEWARIWSVRSSGVLVLVTAVAVVGLGVLIGLDAADDPSGVPADATAWDGGQPSAMFALCGILALSVVTSTADHGTGAIVPTLQWTPRRGVLLAARAGVVVATATLLGVLLVTAASVLVWAIVPGIDLQDRQAVEVLRRGRCNQLRLALTKFRGCPACALQSHGIGRRSGRSCRRVSLLGRRGP